MCYFHVVGIETQCNIFPDGPKGRSDAFRSCSLEAKVPLGRTVITPGAREALSDSDVRRALYRHIRGDWGELDEADWRGNNVSLEKDFRILSAYSSEGGIKFWIITEHDRSVTTILLPAEY